MEQPVQIGLVFPRSGQQLLVTVTARAAETMQAQYADYKSPRVTTDVLSRATRLENDTHA